MNLSAASGSGPLSKTEALELALYWADCGVPVFPVGISWDAEKGGTNKRPLTNRGFHNASADPDVVRKMFGAAHVNDGQEWGVGLHLGPAGIVAFDLDIKGGIDGIAEAGRVGIPLSMYAPSTASGGLHRWFRKRANHPISNVAPEDWSGIDIRADNGYVVAPGTRTTWGNWVPPKTEFDREKLPEVPPGLWETLVGLASSSGVSEWSRYKPEKHDDLLHPLTVEMHQMLVDNFDVNPALTTFHDSGDREPHLRVARPGKGGGISASIGYVGPGAVKMFTSAWKPFKAEAVLDMDDFNLVLRLMKDGATKEEAAFESEVATRLHQRKVDREADRRMRTEVMTDRAAGVTPMSFSDLLKVADESKPIWGIGADVLWADGESLLISGKPGTGKSWIALQIIRARLGLDPHLPQTYAGREPLGFPVVPTSGRVLYLAADRPMQIMRMAKRFLAGVDDHRFVVWPGPTPVSAIGDAADFVTWVETICPGIDTIVFDSVKDFVPRLSSDEDAAAYNNTRQLLLTKGIQVLELHHQRKASAGVTTNDEAFGSMLFTAGAGSVLMLEGEAGAEQIVMKHTKQPMNSLGSMIVEHLREEFMSRATGVGTVTGVLRAAEEDGLTVAQIGVLLYGGDGYQGAGSAQEKQIKRRLENEVAAGNVEKRAGKTEGSKGGRPPQRFVWIGADDSRPETPPEGVSDTAKVPPTGETRGTLPSRNLSETKTAGQTPVSEGVSETSRNSEEPPAEASEKNPVRNSEPLPELSGMTLDEAGDVLGADEVDLLILSGQYELNPENQTLRKVNPDEA